MRIRLLTLVLALAATVPTFAQFPTIRLAVVPSPDETGLLRRLLPDFERETGYRVSVYSGEDVFEVARAGKADLVIAHYGHSGTEAFMNQGLGLWPRALFGNQIAIVGPAEDPAQIRGLQDPTEAFRRIAAGGRSRFVSNNSSVMKYIESILSEAAGRPARGAWYTDVSASEHEGMAVASRMRAYYIFALPPFLEWKEDCRAAHASDARVGPIIPLSDSTDSAACEMDALLMAGSMPHRIMMSIVVNPQRIAAINLTGATALQDYLLRPAVQARIESFRDPGSNYQIWKAAGLHNSGAALGLGRRP